MVEKLGKSTENSGEKLPKIRKNTEKSEKYLENQEKYAIFGKIPLTFEKILKRWKILRKSGKIRKIRKNTSENWEKY